MLMYVAVVYSVARRVDEQLIFPEIKLSWVLLSFWSYRVRCRANDGVVLFIRRPRQKYKL